MGRLPQLTWMPLPREPFFAQSSTASLSACRATGSPVRRTKVDACSNHSIAASTSLTRSPYASLMLTTGIGAGGLPRPVPAIVQAGALMAWVKGDFHAVDASASAGMRLSGRAVPFPPGTASKIRHSSMFLYMSQSFSVEAWDRTPSGGDVTSKRRAMPSGVATVAVSASHQGWLLVLSSAGNVKAKSVVKAAAADAVLPPKAPS